MSFVSKALPLAIAAAALAACSDISSPTQTFSAPAAPLARKGGDNGGGGGGGKDGNVTGLVVTTPPNSDVTGTWTAVEDGNDAIHYYTYTLRMTSEGIVSGSGVMKTATTTASYLIAGTVNGDTLALYVGPGTVCGSCELTPLYRGILASHGTRVEGTFVQGSGSPVTFYKQ
jgi:hypothetical protein